MCVFHQEPTQEKMSGLYPTLEDMKVDQMAQVYSQYIVRLAELLDFGSPPQSLA